MVLMTYVLVRKDLPTFIPDPRAQSLLVAFLKGLYDPIYIDRCEKEYRFLPVKGKLRDMALASIEMLELSTGAPTWIQETDILPEGGQDDYVISTRRKRIFGIQQEILTEKVNRAEAALEEIVEEISGIKSTSRKIQVELEDVAQAQENPDNSWSDEKSRIDASFSMSIVALVLWLMSAMVIYVQQMKLQRLEANQVQVQEQAKKKRSHHHKSSLVEQST